jgi:hypothetical protein
MLFWQQITQHIIVRPILVCKLCKAVKVCNLMYLPVLWKFYSFLSLSFKNLTCLYVSSKNVKNFKLNYFLPFPPTKMFSVARSTLQW